MKRFLFPVVACLLLSQCADDSGHPCNTKATVVDLRGLDGCGFVFELENGSRLEPIRMGYCGTPPVPKEQIADPLYDFEFADGKQVYISYTPADAATTCMAGLPVKITCLTEIRDSSDGR